MERAAQVAGVARCAGGRWQVALGSGEVARGLCEGGLDVGEQGNAEMERIDTREQLEDSSGLEGFRFAHSLRVRWAEVDGQRIVYNANYLMYMDIAYGEYLRRELGLSAGFPSTVMAKTTLEYRRPIEFDDEIRVWVRTSRIGTSSMTVDFVITRDADVMMEAQTVYVYVDASGASTPVPKEWRDRLDQYEPGLHA